MFTRKSQRQLATLRMRPPSTGPRMGPSAVGRVTVAMTRPISRPFAACMISVAMSGIMIPPPMPCTTRKAISAGAFQASALSTEPSRNTASAPIHRRLPPTRAWAHLVSGIVTKTASR